jgi:Asp-tRNA(Asn)/Glu-tRNA(Gln) amidotransferase A subunit family amidase
MAVTEADLAFMPAVEVARRVNAGELDPQAVVREHLARIERFNSRLNAYIDLDSNAAGGRHGPLAGATVGVKESYQVTGLTWTWSSPKFRNQTAAADSAPVTQLKAAGAAVLGKTNAPELVASVGTVSPIFGATQNPWRDGFTPGGSSGGSGAAVAAGLCSFAMGDDLGGSIRMPATCCGVVGFRPSPGRIPHDLGDPTGFDARGPLTRTAGDARAVYRLLARGQSGEPVRLPERARLLLVADTPIGMDDGPRVAVRRAAAALAGAGHHIEDYRGWDPMPVALSYKTVRRVTLAAWPGEPEEYGPAVRGLITEGRPLGAVDYYLAHRDGLTAGQRLGDKLEEGWDAFLTPTIGLVPMRHEEVPAFLGEAWNQHVQFVLPVSYSKLPSISIPAGLAAGLPVGVMLTGRVGGEELLLGLAEQLESLPGFGYQRPPGFD